MNTTKARKVDSNGNVSYEISRNGQVVGNVLKASSGYQAELLSGSWAPVASIKAGQAWIEGLA